MEVADRSGGWKLGCEVLVMPRILCCIGSPGGSSNDESHVGLSAFTGLTGLLPKALNIDRGSLVGPFA
jgi:hypothetical protein